MDAPLPLTNLCVCTVCTLYKGHLHTHLRRYGAGDVLMVMPQNTQEAVEEFLKVMNLNPDQGVSLSQSNPGVSSTPHTSCCAVMCVCVSHTEWAIYFCPTYQIQTSCCTLCVPCVRSSCMCGQSAISAIQLQLHVRTVCLRTYVLWCSAAVCEGCLSMHHTQSSSCSVIYVRTGYVSTVCNPAVCTGCLQMCRVRHEFKCSAFCCLVHRSPTPPSPPPSLYCAMACDSLL